jgi:filamentous hemagglutinin family protein
LFHSFLEFNVNTGRGAYFTNPAGVENILSRVTGSNPSNILGTLGVSGNADLFLINPNGILFGSNARLDVRGSFVASTASGVNFADGTQFSVTNPETRPLLRVSVPIGLQFGATAGTIGVQGSNLGVRPGNTLALVGGDIALEGGILTAPTGRIELGSVAGGSLVTLTPTDRGWALGYEGVATFQDIELSQEALVGSSNASGDIQVQGRRVILTEGSQIVTSTLGLGLEETLLVVASESVELIGTSSGFPSGLFAITPTGQNVGGGSLTIETGRLLIQDGAQASASTLGQGRAAEL